MSTRVQLGIYQTIHTDDALVIGIGLDVVRRNDYLIVLHEFAVVLVINAAAYDDSWLSWLSLRSLIRRKNG